MSGKRLALLIGNAEYQNPELRKLRSPHHDVTALGSLIERPNIAGYQAKILKDSTKASIEREIDRILTDGVRDDTFLFFFAGHGIKHQNGKLFFAAVDSDPKYLPSTAVSANWLMEQMQNSRVGLQIVMLDCCFAGAFDRGTAFRGGELVESGEALKVPNLKEGRGQVVIASADAMQFALEGGEFAFEVGGRRDKTASSYFLRALTEGLETGDADREPQDGRITIEELVSYLGRKVEELGSPQKLKTWIFGAREGELLFANNPNKKVTNSDTIVRDEILRQVNRIQTRFAKPGSVPPLELQRLALPLSRLANRLRSFDVVDELLSQKSSGDENDAAVFSAANLIYERQVLRFYDALVELIKPGRPVRAAAMWRVLRTIKLLLGFKDIKLTDERREQLFRALANAAKWYDEKPGQRFTEYTIPRKVLDIAKLKKTRLAERLGEIFDKSQYRELKSSRSVRD